MFYNTTHIVNCLSCKTLRVVTNNEGLKICFVSKYASFWSAVMYNIINNLILWFISWQGKREWECRSGKQQLALSWILSDSSSWRVGKAPDCPSNPCILLCPPRMSPGHQQPPGRSRQASRMASLCWGSLRRHFPSPAAPSPPPSSPPPSAPACPSPSFRRPGYWKARQQSLKCWSFLKSVWVFQSYLDARLSPTTSSVASA